MVQISAPQHLPVRSYECGKKSERNHGLYSMHFGQKQKNFHFNKKLRVGQTGYFLVGGKEGDLPRLDCCLPPLQIGSNNSVLYFPKDNTPQDPPTTGSHANIPPFKISLEKTLH